MLTARTLYTPRTISYSAVKNIFRRVSAVLSYQFLAPKMIPISCKCLVFVVMWCVSETWCYSVQKIEDDNGVPVNVEIGFDSDLESRKFIDALLKDMQMENRRQFYASHEPTPPSTSTVVYSAEGSNDTNIRRMFLLFVTPHKNYTGDNDPTPLDSWSVVWYIASFGGLIAFFLIVSCSEWCCRRAVRNQTNCGSPAAIPSTPTVSDTPPPSYDQFAPPSYESICLGRNGSGSEKREYDIYVVPVHALGTIIESNREEEAPPSYLSANSREPQFSPVYPPMRDSRQLQDRNSEFGATT